MKLISCIILAGCGAISCSQHVYYYPTAPSAPLLTEKGDAMVSAGSYARGILDFKGWSVQAAYSPVKKFSIITNAVIINENFSKSLAGGKNRSLDLGVSYVMPLGKVNKWFMEGSVGRGYSAVKHKYKQGFFSQVNSEKTFLQTALAIRYADSEVAFFHRVNWIHWRLTRSDSIIVGMEDDSEMLLKIIEHPSFFTADLGFICRFRLGSSRINGQVSLLFPTVDARRNYLPVESGVFTIGASYKVFTAKKSKKSASNIL